MLNLSTPFLFSISSPFPLSPICVSLLFSSLKLTRSLLVKKKPSQRRQLIATHRCRCYSLQQTPSLLPSMD
uniref:Uncharacterized protein n=1 Tax=Manihot esculenta TaxID=3983 RepID=A0A2C9W4W3_MANES